MKSTSTRVTSVANKTMAAGYEEQDTIEMNSYFKVMGYLHRNLKMYYCIHSYPDYKVHFYRARNFSHIGLCRLAPMDTFWIPRFPSPRGKLNRLAALDAMFRLAERRGPCEPHMMAAAGWKP